MTWHREQIAGFLKASENFFDVSVRPGDGSEIERSQDRNNRDHAQKLDHGQPPFPASAGNYLACDLFGFPVHLFVDKISKLQWFLMGLQGI
jgi:hypothetical protein